ncbi:MAG: hypothetical protein K0Q96_2197 [Rubrobacteraceae bacterium]|nr:hypothetical protein [Rubrobacteraceae bacterium]
MRCVPDLLLPPFGVRDGKVADQRPGHDAGVGPGDVAAVDRGDPAVILQVLDHGDRAVPCGELRGAVGRARVDDYDLPLESSFLRV